jgi:hypothetical protein
MWTGSVSLCGVCGNWVRGQDVDRISRFVCSLWKLGKILGCRQYQYVCVEFVEIG